MSENNALITVSRTISAPDMQQQFQRLLPANVPLDRFTEVTMMAIRQNPEVLEADRQTLYDACLSLARRGLMPDKKEAALTIFNTNIAKKGEPEKWKKQVQAMPMVEGIIKELAKAGIKAYAVSVYANDRIELWNDDEGQHVRHKPVMFGDRGIRIGCFAAGKMPDGRTYVEAMNMEDIAKVRSRSKQKDREGNPTGTWKTDPERMEQKSALHRLRKRMPIVDAEEALQNLKDMEEESDIDLSPDSPQTTGSDDNFKEASQEARRESNKKRPRALQAVIEQTRSDQGMDQPHHGHDSQEEDII